MAEQKKPAEKTAEPKQEAGKVDPTPMVNPEAKPNEVSDPDKAPAASGNTHVSQVNTDEQTAYVAPKD